MALLCCLFVGSLQGHCQVQVPRGRPWLCCMCVRFLWLEPRRFCILQLEMFCSRNVGFAAQPLFVTLPVQAQHTVHSLVQKNLFTDWYYQEWCLKQKHAIKTTVHPVSNASSHHCTKHLNLLMLTPGCVHCRRPPPSPWLHHSSTRMLHDGLAGQHASHRGTW